MTQSPAQALATDLTVIPEKTPIFIGVGVLNEGKITLKNSDPGKDLRVVIAGEHIGDISAPADIVQVINGGSLKPSDKITCRHLVVAGSLIAPGTEIHAEKVSLLATAVLSVGVLHTQALEQSMGCRLNAQIAMGEPKTPADAPAASAFTAPSSGPEISAAHGDGDHTGSRFSSDDDGATPSVTIVAQN